MIEDSHITQTLYHDVLVPSPNVDLVHFAKITRVDNSSSSPLASVTTADDATYSAPLVIACDGPNSFVRTALNMPLTSHAYGRKAMICTVKIPASYSSRGRATPFQRFFASGPIAYLPMFGDYYSVVWSTTVDEFERLQSLTPEAFLEQLNAKMLPGPALPPDLFDPQFTEALPGPLRGLSVGVSELMKMSLTGLALVNMNELTPSEGSFVPTPTATELCSPRVGFDLKVQNAHSYSSNRVALCGDAAHSIHPMAGQGLNLGIGDVECLADLIAECVYTGGDLGDDYLLERYDNNRQGKVKSVLAGVHLLHEVFKQESSLGVWGRGLGMTLFNAAGPVKRKIARAAAGLD
jgi:ubiquinone biosynthesis monooxygenase Coq6